MGAHDGRVEHLDEMGDELMAASASKKASKTPALLSRSKRFQTLFQGPKRSGKARQRTFSTVKK
jgi:hypothetical protein